MKTLIKLLDFELDTSTFATFEVVRDEVRVAEIMFMFECNNVVSLNAIDENITRTELIQLSAIADEMLDNFFNEMPEDYDHHERDITALNII